MSRIKPGKKKSNLAKRKKKAIPEDIFTASDLKLIKESTELWYQTTMEDLEKERPPSNFSNFESLEDWENYEKHLNYQEKKVPYTEVNECLKKFVKDRDVDYLHSIVGLLWVDAFRCPPFIRILSILREKYASATRYHTKKSKEVTAIKKFAQGIGEALLMRAWFKKLHKPELLLDAVEGNRHYIQAKYARHLKSLRNRNKEKSLERDRESLKQNQCRLQQELSKGNSANPKQIKQFEIEIKRLESSISKLEKEEKEAHKEAKRRTRTELYKETDYTIGNRNLESIITQKPRRLKLLDLK